MSELLGSLTDYFVIESPSSVQTRNAYLYAMGLSLASLYSVYGFAFHSHDGLILGMMTRIMMLSAIYKKVYLLYSYPFIDVIKPGQARARGGFIRKLERKLKIKFFAHFNAIYCHDCHIRLPLSNNCRDTWNKNVIKSCRIIQETILKHEKKRYMSQVISYAYCFMWLT